MTSLRKPIKHRDLIKLLLDAIMLPAQLAIVKCDAHTSGTDSVSLGHERSDFLNLCGTSMCLPTTNTTHFVALL